MVSLILDGKSLTKGAMTRSRKPEMSPMGQPKRRQWVYLDCRRFVNFAQEVHNRCARCGEYEVFRSLREITGCDNAMNDLRTGGLMSGSQILVKPAVKSGVPY